MEAYAFIKVANQLQKEVLAIVKGISDVSLEALQGFNLILLQAAIGREVQLNLDPNDPNKSQTHRNFRREYRAHACTNAAKVLYRCLYLWSMKTGKNM